MLSEQEREERRAGRALLVRPFYPPRPARLARMVRALSDINGEAAGVLERVAELRMELQEQANKMNALRRRSAFLINVTDRQEIQHTSLVEQTVVASERAIGLNS